MSAGQLVDKWNINIIENWIILYIDFNLSFGKEYW